MRRVLIVDDDPHFVDAIREELEAGGYTVTEARDADALRVALPTEPPHVVLLDVRLGGPGSGRHVADELDGLSLVPELLVSWPLTRVIVVTGFVAVDVVRRAYGAGAADILRKDEVLAEMLRFKVRRAADEADRAFAADPTQRERALREAWARCRVEEDRHRKGLALEQVVAMILASIPGLGAYQRWRSATEEFDLVVANQSTNPFLAQQGSVWLLECKNWSTRSGVPALHPLLEKRGRCRLGIAVSVKGFASTVRDELLRTSRDESLVVLVDGEALEAWIAAPDREAWLVQRITEAATR